MTLSHSVFASVLLPSVLRVYPPPPPAGERSRLGGLAAFQHPLGGNLAAQIQDAATLAALQGVAVVCCGENMGKCGYGVGAGTLSEQGQ